MSDEGVSRSSRGFGSRKTGTGSASSMPSASTLQSQANTFTPAFSARSSASPNAGCIFQLGRKRLTPFIWITNST